MALAFSTIHPPPSNALRLDFLRFSPQPLKAVEFAGFMIEDMGDHGAEIKQHPFALHKPLDVESLHLEMLHLVHKMHSDGFHMAVAIPVTDQEIMREAGVS